MIRNRKFKLAIIWAMIVFGYVSFTPIILSYFGLVAGAGDVGDVGLPGLYSIIAFFMSLSLWRGEKNIHTQLLLVLSFILLIPAVLFIGAFLIFIFTVMAI